MLALQLVGVVMRREHKTELPYLLLLAGDLVLLAAVHAFGADGSLLGKVASSLAFVMVLAPRFVDGVERRAFARDDLDGALRAARLRELFQPGLGSTRRRRQLTNFVEARAGGAMAVLRRLDDELTKTRDADQIASILVERATVLFMAQRWRECVDTTARLPPRWAAEHPVLGAYVVRAHGELGELVEAAEALHVVESGVAGRDPAALGLLTQARLTLLAFAGRQGDVDRLLATEARLLVSPRAAATMHDIARDRAGTPLSEPLAATLDRVARAAAEGARPLVRPRRAAYVTVALVVVNVAAAIVSTHLAMQPSAADLIRAGALFRPAVHAGEWWRGFSAMFLHAGPWHLGLNMYALYMLGRFCEEIFGSLRYFVVYVVGGIAGAIGSTVVTEQAGLSVGASGAIMGLLGALIVVLIIRRGTWPEAWRRALLWNLVLLGGLQIYIGFEIPMIDNAAHVGGMIGGGAMALLVAPGGLIGHSLPARVVVVALALAGLAGLAWAAVGVARTPLDATLEKLPTHVVDVGGYKLRVPEYWEVDRDHDVVFDPYLDVQLPLPASHDVPSPPADPRVKRFVDHIWTSAEKERP